MNDPLLSLLGIARRAGMLTLGFDAVCEDVNKGKSSLVLTAKDISDGSLRKLENHISTSEVGIIEIPHDINDICAALGRKVRIISINDSGFAKKALSLLQSGNGEEKTYDN